MNYQESVKSKLAYELYVETFGRHQRERQVKQQIYRQIKKHLRTPAGRIQYKWWKRLYVSESPVIKEQYRLTGSFDGPYLEVFQVPEGFIHLPLLLHNVDVVRTAFVEDMVWMAGW